MKWFGWPLALLGSFGFVEPMRSAQPGPDAASGRPVTLEQAVGEALAKNLDLAAERYGVTVAAAREITAALRPNPVLTVAGQTLNVFPPRYAPTSPAGPNQFNLHTELPIERGGKRAERVAFARDQKSLAELGVREVMRQVVFAAQSAFVDVLQAKDTLALARENLKSLEGVVSVNVARVASGDLAQVELDRSRLAALQYRTAVQQAQLQVEQAKSQLQLVMGRRAGAADFEIEGGLRREDLARPIAEIASLAMTRRPDYIMAQQSQSRSRADLRLQIANGKVDYSVGTEYTYQRAYGVGGSSLGLYFSVPLPVWNKNQGEIARAQREIDQAGARIAALEAGIRTEVDKAFRQYTFSKRLLTDIETDVLAKARGVRDTTEYSYRRGEATLVEFLDAQRAFNDAMQTYNEARAAYARSLYLIDSVSGANAAGS